MIEGEELLFESLDFRLRGGVPYFLEANPLPGLSPQYSDLVLMARSLGIDHPQLIERIVRAKKPWAVAAAAALFLGAGLLATGYAINYNAVTAKTIQAEDAKAKSMLDTISEAMKATQGATSQGERSRGSSVTNDR